MVMSNDDYERKCQRIKRFNNKLLYEFGIWLEQSNFTNKTIKIYLSYTDLFINTYLLYQNTIEVQDGIQHLSQFFNDWYIKNSFPNTSSMKKQAISLKKFYTFLHQKGLVEKKDLVFLKDIIKREMSEWLANLEKYNKLSSLIGSDDKPQLTNMNVVWERLLNMGGNKVNINHLPKNDFTSDLWLFISPWYDEGKIYEQHIETLIFAGIEIWNYCITGDAKTKEEIVNNFNGFFPIPVEELIEILMKRKSVFFADDNRLISDNAVIRWYDGDFQVFVDFYDPNTFNT